MFLKIYTHTYILLYKYTIYKTMLLVQLNEATTIDQLTFASSFSSTSV